MSENDIKRSRLWIEAYLDKQAHPEIPVSAETLYAQRLAILGGRENIFLARRILEEQFGSQIDEASFGRLRPKPIAEVIVNRVEKIVNRDQKCQR